jgi:hypothetical protein
MRTQTDDIIDFFFNLSQGFINKSSYKSQDTFLNSNLIPHRTNANVLVRNSSNEWNLSNPASESKDSDF